MDDDRMKNARIGADALFHSMPDIVNKNLARIMKDQKAKGDDREFLTSVAFNGHESPWEVTEKIAEMLGVPVEELTRECEGEVVTFRVMHGAGDDRRGIDVRGDGA